jgi:hypothetical protein
MSPTKFILPLILNSCMQSLSPDKFSTFSNRLAAHSKLLSDVFLIDASAWAQLAIGD